MPRDRLWFFWGGTSVCKLYRYVPPDRVWFSGGGVLPYVSYTGMCRGIGYGFRGGGVLPYVSYTDMCHRIGYGFGGGGGYFCM